MASIHALDNAQRRILTRMSSANKRKSAMPFHRRCNVLITDATYKLNNGGEAGFPCRSPLQNSAPRLLHRPAIAGYAHQSLPAPLQTPRPTTEICAHRNIAESTSGSTEQYALC